jgi:hypothetical protein
MLKVKIKSSCIHACIHEKTLDKQNNTAYTITIKNKGGGARMTDVMDLATGNVYTYDAKPKEALIMCFEQISKGNYNTWSYNFNQSIVETDLCYSIGDVAVFKDGRSIK